jgi:succinate dehydrogenase hydrophobic anchor subunit
MTRLCDLGLGVVLPFHAHVGLNTVVSDYVPYAYRRAPPRNPPLLQLATNIHMTCVAWRADW